MKLSNIIVKPHKRLLIEGRLRSWFYWQVVTYNNFIKAVAWRYGDNYYTMQVPPDKYIMYEAHVAYVGCCVCVVFGLKKIYIIHNDKFYIANYPNTIVYNTNVSTSFNGVQLSIRFVYSKWEKIVTCDNDISLEGSIVAYYNLKNLQMVKIQYASGKFDVSPNPSPMVLDLEGTVKNFAENTTTMYSSDDVIACRMFWDSNVISCTEW